MKAVPALEGIPDQVFENFKVGAIEHRNAGILAIGKGLTAALKLLKELEGLFQNNGYTIAQKQLLDIVTVAWSLFDNKADVSSSREFHHDAPFMAHFEFGRGRRTYTGQCGVEADYLIDSGTDTRVAKWHASSSE